MADAGLVPIKRALVSVFDKASIQDLAAALKEVSVSCIDECEWHASTQMTSLSRERIDTSQPVAVLN